MGKTVLWLLASCLLVLSLVLASCASPTPPTQEKPAPSAPTQETPTAPQPKEEKPTTTPAKEGPKYGGVLIEAFSTPPLYFDETYGYQGPARTINLTNEELLRGDWAKGPAGTGESSWIYTIFFVRDRAGGLAESWEMPDDQTIVYHLRKGVRFHNKPPTNGRELVASDVVFSLNRLWDIPTSLPYNSYPRKTYIESFTAPDKYTVVIKVLPGRQGQIFKIASDLATIVPPEMVEKYGNMSDWRNACGTGPFMLVDFVSGSSATFEKNPNYWGKDPLNSNNQLPYLDGVKDLTIPDLSTRLAAIRTAKVDHVYGVAQEDADSLIKTNPDLKYLAYASSTAPTLFMRTDTPPFNDIRVRRALSMAIDKQAIANSIYRGKADILTWPASNIPEWKAAHVPLDQLPQSVRELFEYHPDKAKQLLAEAGFPNGFKTEVVTYDTYTDLMAVAQKYFADIGVEMKIDVREYSVYTSIGTSRGYKQMYMQFTVGYQPDVIGPTVPKRFDNFSIIDDPKINDAKKLIDAAYFKEAERDQTIRGIIPHMLDQAYFIQFPAGYSYTFWEPWVKNYHGELMIGYANVNDFPKYIWLDQDLKERTTGRK